MLRHRLDPSSAVLKLCLPSSHPAPGMDEYHTAALSRVFLVHVMPMDDSADEARAAVSSSSFSRHHTIRLLFALTVTSWS